MLFRKRKDLSLVSHNVKCIIVDLKKVFGVKQYYTDSGGYEGDKHIFRNARVTEIDTMEDVIHIVSYNSIYTLEGTCIIADHNERTGITYLYSVPDFNLIKVHRGSIMSTGRPTYHVADLKMLREYIIND